MSIWNIICLRNMLKAKSDNDIVSYYYWKDMLVEHTY